MIDYKKLNVYKDTSDVVIKIYEITKAFPKEELYGLTSQIRRAAVSILANIAEGSSRYTQKDFAHFIQMSIGSVNECKCLLELSKELKYISSDKLVVTNELDNLRRRLIALSKQIRTNI